MSDRSRIEWTDATWNPVRGCTKISPGCKHCYAERMAGRLQAMGVDRYRNGFEVTLQPCCPFVPASDSPGQTRTLSLQDDWWQ